VLLIWCRVGVGLRVQDKEAAGVTDFM